MIQTQKNNTADILKGVNIMLEYNVNLCSVSRLFRLRRLVRGNNLHGYAQQKFFHTNLRSTLLMFLAMPLKELTVVIDDCPADRADEIRSRLQELAA